LERFEELTIENDPFWVGYEIVWIYKFTLVEVDKSEKLLDLRVGQLLIIK
jgi:hypothetical protein